MYIQSNYAKLTYGHCALELFNLGYFSTSSLAILSLSCLLTVLLQAYMAWAVYFATFLYSSTATFPLLNPSSTSSGKFGNLNGLGRVSFPSSKFMTEGCIMRHLLCAIDENYSHIHLLSEATIYVYVCAILLSSTCGACRSSSLAVCLVCGSCMYVSAWIMYSIFTVKLNVYLVTAPFFTMLCMWSRCSLLWEWCMQIIFLGSVLRVWFLYVSG